MNKNDTEILKFIESNGFLLDKEDYIWYTRDYSKRIALQKYCKQPYSIYYNEGVFNNGKSFTTVLELQDLMKAES